MPIRQIIDIGVTGQTFNIDLGQLCDGETVDIRFCNTDGAHTYTFNTCACPVFSGLPASEDFTSCECNTYTLTFNGTGQPGFGECLILVSRSASDVVRVYLKFEEVYCEPTLTAFDLVDDDGIVGIDETTFNPSCDVYYGTCMGARENLSLVYSLTNPIVAGDVLFLSQWLFAQLSQWNYADFPTAGWKYRVCTVDGEEPTVDGTFQMEWYGEQPSEENSADSPYITCIIGSGGTTVEFQIKFNMPQDTQIAPTNVSLANHRQLLANAVSNFQELDNDAENSIYRNPKYMAWTWVIYRSVGNVYQKSFFNIKGEFPYYGERSVIPTSAMTLQLNSLTLERLATGTATEYLSTTRGTKITVDFDYTSGNVAGTPPDSLELYLIRTDTFNNQLDYYQNYEYQQANLTTLTASTNITPTVAPVNTSGNNFTAEFNVTALHPELEGLIQSVRYRFILVARSLIDQESRSDISEQIELINYDDEQILMPTLELVWRTLEQEYSPNDRILRDTCVNLPIESVLKLDIATLNAQVSAKTGGQITDASGALKSVRLNVYETNPLTGNLLLDTMFFQPELKRVCGGQFEAGVDVDFVDNTQGTQMEIVFPFNIPDNIYRNIGREGLFQREDGSFARVPVVNADLDCVAQTQANLCNFGSVAGTLVGGNVDRYSYMIYVPQTQEIWATNNIANEIDIFDINTYNYVASIATTVGYTDCRVLLVGTSVYATAIGQPDVLVYDIFTRTLVTTIVVDTSLQAVAYNPVANEIIVGDATTFSLYKINPVTNAIIGAPLVLPVGSSISSIMYAQQTNELWVTCRVTDTLEVINYTTFAIVATIALPVGVGGGVPIIQDGNNIFVADQTNSNIEVYDLITRTNIFTMPVPVASAMPTLTVAGGVLYVPMAQNEVILSYDTQSFAFINSHLVAVNAQPFQALFAMGALYVSSRYAIDYPETIFVFDADCQQQLPPFTMRNRNITMDWELEFELFDNTEIYHAYQRIERPKFSEIWDVDVLPYDSIDDVEIDTIPVGDANPCATTGGVTIDADWGVGTSNRQLFAVGLEIMPVRGGLVSEQTATPAVANIIQPLNSPYIKGVQPQFNAVGNIQFQLDYPELPIDGDYQIYLHFIIRP
jgi:hypothetical protein